MTRIYVVTNGLNEARLIRAKNRNEARAYVVRDTMSVKLAEADQLVALTKAGVNVEDAVESVP